MKKIFVLLTILFVSGCVHFKPVQATSGNYKQMLDEWIGRPKAELTAVWGMPTHDYWRENKNYIIYIKSRVVEVAQGNAIERMPQSTQESFLTKDKGLVSKACTTLFTIIDDKVTAWKFDGNDCLAYEPGY